MSSFTLKIVAGALPQVAASNQSKVKEPLATVKRAAQPQVRVQEVQKLQTHEKPSNFSRRDLGLFLAAASFTATTLSFPRPAEARISKGEIKKKILEKLKMLREKAGLSKPETEEKDEVAPPPPSREEKEIPVPPLPNLHDSHKKSLVEATVL